MHKNSRFNIVQAPGNCSRDFVVIDGQRTDSGHMAIGAKVVSGPTSRAIAIEHADYLQDLADNPGLIDHLREGLKNLRANASDLTIAVHNRDWYAARSRRDAALLKILDSTN